MDEYKDGEMNVRVKAKEIVELVQVVGLVVNEFLLI